MPSSTTKSRLTNIGTLTIKQDIASNDLKCENRKAATFPTTRGRPDYKKATARWVILNHTLWLLCTSFRKVVLPVEQIKRLVWSFIKRVKQSSFVPCSKFETKPMIRRNSNTQEIAPQRNLLTWTRGSNDNRQSHLVAAVPLLFLLLLSKERKRIATKSGECVKNASCGFCYWRKSESRKMTRSFAREDWK